MLPRPLVATTSAIKPVACIVTSAFWSSRQCRLAFGVRRDLSSTTASHRHEQRTILAGTVLADKLRTPPFGQLIEYLSPRPETSPHFTDGRLTLLLTTAFAQQALDGSLASSILDRLGIDVKDSKSLEVLTAVVDGLPFPGNRPARAEGLAYLLEDQAAFSDYHCVLLQKSTETSGSLTFALETDVSLRVQLPLAPTIFSTGRPCTLIRHQYVSKDGTMVSLSETQLESATVDIHVGQSQSWDVFAPLVPMTPCHEVTNSMGNIVRTLSSDGWTTTTEDPAKWLPGDSAPQLQASRELEVAVAEYFKVLGKPPEPVKVWALVVPAELRAQSEQWRLTSATESPNITATWRNGSDLSESSPISKVSEELTTLLKSGCRLCCVLSGGGGWGKKAGLLSLDPDSEYSTRSLRGDEGWEFTFGDEDAVAQKNQALGQIVKPGEGVMFFLAPTLLIERLAIGGHSQTHISDQRDPSAQLIFGTLPSSIDEILGANSTTSSEQNPDVAIQHLPGTFGFLSEGGMAITIERDDSSRTQTKIDVPFARLTIPAHSSKTPASRSSGELSQSSRSGNADSGSEPPRTQHTAAEQQDIKSQGMGNESNEAQQESPEGSFPHRPPPIIPRSTRFTAPAGRKASKKLQRRTSPTGPRIKKIYHNVHNSGSAATAQQAKSHWMALMNEMKVNLIQKCGRGAFDNLFQKCLPGGQVIRRVYQRGPVDSGVPIHKIQYRIVRKHEMSNRGPGPQAKVGKHEITRAVNRLLSRSDSLPSLDQRLAVRDKAWLAFRDDANTSKERHTAKRNSRSSLVSNKTPLVKRIFVRPQPS